MAGDIIRKSVTIASGGQDSAALTIDPGYVVAGVFSPASLTSTSMKYKTSSDGATYVLMEDGAGNDLSDTISGGEYVSFSSDKISRFKGLTDLKIRTASAETPGVSFIVVLRQNP